MGEAGWPLLHAGKPTLAPGEQLPRTPIQRELCWEPEMGQLAVGQLINFDGAVTDNNNKTKSIQKHKSYNNVNENVVNNITSH